MKKTYINPATEIVNVETAQMIALSTGDSYNGNDDIESRDDEFDIWNVIK